MGSSVTGLRTRIEAAGSPDICLATVLVDGGPPSQRYVRSKHEKAAEAGLVSRHVDLPATATQAEVESAVRGPVIERRHPRSAAISYIAVPARDTNIAPRSSDPDHRRQNADVFDFELSDEEMRRIQELSRS